MKKFLTFILTLLSLAFAATPSSTVNNTINNPKRIAGLSSIIYGKMYYKEGKLDHIFGLTFFGIGYRKYFDNNQKLEGTHYYWETGTQLLLIPYGAVGLNYFMPNNKNYFVFDAGVGLSIIFPFIKLGISYAF